MQRCTTRNQTPHFVVEIHSEYSVQLTRNIYMIIIIMSHLFGEDEEDPQIAEQNYDDDDDNEEEEDVLDMEGTTMNTQVGALLMRFCPHDSSMLYPQVRIYVYRCMCILA